MHIVLSIKGAKLARVMGQAQLSMKKLRRLRHQRGPVPGICMAKRCNHVINVDPEQRAGICPVCDDNTITSVLILAGLV